MRTRHLQWLGLLVAAAPGCGSSSGAPFTPTTPVADVCGMLALPDVQMIVPDATAGSPLPDDDNADMWSRGCQWQGSGGVAISLVVDGALNSNGNQVLNILVEANSNSTTQATAVYGVGDKAVYLVNQGLDQLLNAKQGSILVSLAVYNFPQPVPEASMQPLVVEALSKL